MLCRRNTACLRHCSLSLLSSSLLFTSFSVPSPLLYIASRCAKGRPALVVIWLHCYPLCREFGVHSYPLPLLLPHFSAAKHAHVNTHTHIYIPISRFHAVYLFSSHSLSLLFLSLFLGPSPSFLYLSFFLHFFLYHSFTCSRSRYYYAGTRCT